ALRLAFISIAADNVNYPYSDYIIREQMFAIWYGIDRRILTICARDTISLFTECVKRHFDPMNTNLVVANIPLCTLSATDDSLARGLPN
ncbi:MAG: hypothetical protein ACI4MP_00950, partial [Candidatus Ventricola sp.]